MSILVFEFISGGGLLLCPGPPQPAGSLAVEGLAMARGLVEDLARSTAAPVTQLVDARLSPTLTTLTAINVNQIVVETRSSLARALRDQAQACDKTLAIAPEREGWLQRTREIVTEAGGNWLGCNAELLAWAGDKTATSNRLAAARIPVPKGFACVGAPEPLPAPPVVVKPNDGAGSEETRLVATVSQWEAMRWHDREYRIERYHRGQAASLAVLCGPEHRQMLAPCLQFIDSQHSLAYRGGCVLPSGALADRIRALGAGVLPLLNGALGFVGIDMVLGSATDGSEDVVIEVNPRLTTSYVGLRAAFDGNLGQALLDVAGGNNVPVDFPDTPLEFRADGAVLQPSEPGREH